MTCFSGGDDMPRRRSKREPIQKLPRLVRGVVGNRAVCELKFGDDPGGIVPGSIRIMRDPESVSGAEREAAVWNIIAKANLDVKEDYERIYDAIWANTPKPKPGV